MSGWALRPKRLTGLLALLVFLPACGASSGGVSPSQSQAPGARDPLIVVESGRWPSSTDPQPVRTLRLVNLKGVEVTSVKPPVGSYGVTFVGTAGSRVVYIESGTHTDASGKQAAGPFTVKAIHRDGKVETMHAFGQAYPNNPVLSPDGKQLLWTEINPGSPDYAVAHSLLHLTTLGGADRVIASFDGAGIPGRGVLAGYRWDAGGIIVAHRSAGWPQPALRADVWDAYVLDAQSGTMSPLWPTSTCTLPARAADGTVACVLLDLSWKADNTFTLQVGKPPEASISTRVKADPGLGSISFKPGPAASLLAIGVQRVCDALPNGAYVYCFGPTSLLDVKTGQLRTFGPDGMIPPNGSWAWLDDGSLIEWNIDPAQADPQTTEMRDVTYVVSPDGKVRRLAVGYPLGVLRG